MIKCDIANEKLASRGAESISEKTLFLKTCYMLQEPRSNFEIGGGGGGGGGGAPLVTQYWGGDTSHFFLLILYNFKKGYVPPPPPTPRSLC